MLPPPSPDSPSDRCEHPGVLTCRHGSRFASLGYAFGRISVLEGLRRGPASPATGWGQGHGCSSSIHPAPCSYTRSDPCKAPNAAELDCQKLQSSAAKSCGAAFPL